MIDNKKSPRNDARPRVSVSIVLLWVEQEIPAHESVLNAVPVEVFLVDHASPDCTTAYGCWIRPHCEHLPVEIRDDGRLGCRTLPDETVKETMFSSYSRPVPYRQ